jgi:hypothetical protein
MNLIEPFSYSESELRTFKTFSNVILKIFHYKIRFLQRLIKRCGNAVWLSFVTIEDQVKFLKDITRLFNKCELDFDDTLDKLPIRPINLQEMLIRRQSLGYIEDDLVLNEIDDCKRRGVQHIAIYLASALLGTTEDIAQLSLIAIGDLPGVSCHDILREELYIENPQYCQYLVSTYDPNYRRDEDMEKKMLILYKKKICANCRGTDCQKRCSVCNVTYYCNRKCQTDNWSKHKLICKSLRILKLMRFLDK